jgi:aerobic carbon-monoxide dehydrogenase medium subunit
MKPAPFEYFDPTTVPAALSLLARHGEEAKLLAGGQSLVPLMNMRLARPGHVIDLNRIVELAYIEEMEGGLRIGSMTRQDALEHSPTVAARCPLLPEALALIGHPAIRNRGTIGGSLAHADPAAELPAAILALDGRISVTSLRGTRRLPVTSFFVGALTTALAPDEVLTEIELPALPPATGTCFLEVARRHGDFALVGAAVIVSACPDGSCGHVRLAFCGAGDTPVRVERAEALLAGRRPDPELLTEVEALVRETLEPGSDLHASADYRREVAGVLARRALVLAWKRASHA